MANPLINLTNPNVITTDGSTVNATAWTNDWSTIVNYINASLTASFNVFSNKGDILVYDGTNIQALNASSVTNGWVLTANNMAPFGLQWESPPGLPTNTDGDMLYYDGGNTRLPIGSNGQILTVSPSGFPEWSTTTPITVFTKGMVMLWSGSISTIPVGWSLMDGQSNASGINLQGLFVVAAGGSSPGATGGMGLLNPGGPFGDNSAGAGLGPSHTHSQNFNYEVVQAGNGNQALFITSNNLTTVTPKYYALCYIEKQ